jgi:hypothetical protein
MVATSAGTADIKQSATSVYHLPEAGQTEQTIRTHLMKTHILQFKNNNFVVGNLKAATESINNSISTVTDKSPKESYGSLITYISTDENLNGNKTAMNQF